MKKIAPFWVGFIALVAIIGTYGIGYYGGFFGQPAGGVSDQVATTTTLANSLGQTISISTPTTKQVDVSVEDRYTPGTKLDVIARCYKQEVGKTSWDLQDDVATTGTNDLPANPGDKLVCMVGNDNASTVGFVPGIAIGQNGTRGWYVEKIDYTVGDIPSPTASPGRQLAKQGTAPTVKVFSDTYTVLSDGTANLTISEGTNYNLLVTIQANSEEAYGHPIEPEVTGLGYSNVACLEWNRTVILKTDIKMTKDGESAEWQSFDTPSILSVGVGNITKCWKVPFDIIDGGKPKANIVFKTNPDVGFGSGRESMMLRMYDVSMYHDTTASAPRDFSAFKFGIVDNLDNNIGIPSANEVSTRIELKLS